MTTKTETYRSQAALAWLLSTLAVRTSVLVQGVAARRILDRAINLRYAEEHPDPGATIVSGETVTWPKAAFITETGRAWLRRFIQAESQEGMTWEVAISTSGGRSRHFRSFVETNVDRRLAEKFLAACNDEDAYVLPHSPGEVVCPRTGLIRCLAGQAVYVVSRGEVYRGCFFLRFPLDV
jgi:hypothetical protein